MTTTQSQTLADSELVDHERIWLQNAKDSEHQGEGRLWCQDKVWPDHEDDGEPTEYIRADIHADRIAALSAEVERLTKERDEAAEVIKPFAAVRYSGGNAFNRADLSDDDFRAARAWLANRGEGE